MKKLSGWYRLFIIFAILWTILSIGRLVVGLDDISSRWQIEIDTIDKSKDIEIQKITEGNLRVVERGAKKDARQLFLFYWLAPIGLVYISGWCVGWIIRGFRKED